LRLSLTNVLLESPTGIVRCLDATATLFVVSMLPSNPAKNEDACYIVVSQYEYFLPCKSFLRFII